MNPSPIWHPCSQMKDYETFQPLDIVAAEGPWIELADGHRLLDAVSSWWCKSLGHGHPRLKAALTAQLEQFEHVILANTTNAPIRELSTRLTELCGLEYVFYAGDGATAVDIAVKMAIQAQALRGNASRTGLLALDQGYHGDTALCMGLSDQGIFKAPFASLCPAVPYLGGLPLRSGQEDPAWHSCAAEWPQLEAQLAPHRDTLAAIVLEPVVQGAAGMRVYSPDLLRALRTWCDQNQVYLIADEIMTGMGRTGTALACEHAGIIPDFACLSKGLTAGWLAFSAVLTREPIYQLFYDDYDHGRNFLHSNTFSGNALAVAVALETLNVYRDEQTFAESATLQTRMRAGLQTVSDAVGCLGPFRGIGGLIATDLILPEQLQDQRIGYQIYQEATRLGALLRPIGNTLYWLPPLNISQDDIICLSEITRDAIQRVGNRLDFLP